LSHTNWPKTDQVGPRQTGAADELGIAADTPVVAGTIDSITSAAGSGALAADAASVTTEGLQFMPWLLGSVAPKPNDDVRGAYVGMSLLHDRRALLSFLAFNALGMLDLADVPSLLHTAEVHDPNPHNRDHMRDALHRHAALHPFL